MSAFFFSAAVVLINKTKVVTPEDKKGPPRNRQTAILSSIKIPIF